MNIHTPELRIAVLAALAVVATAAYAASAHFVRGPTASLNSSNGHVTVNWKEAGLGDTVRVASLASAAGTARYQCVTRGGNCPAASNKQNVSSAVTADGTFSPKNGTVTASLEFEPPAGTLKCPGGQVLKMVSVSYTDIALDDLTNGVHAGAIPDALAMAGPECP